MKKQMLLNWTNHPLIRLIASIVLREISSIFCVTAYLEAV